MSNFDSAPEFYKRFDIKKGNNSATVLVGTHMLFYKKEYGVLQGLLSRMELGYVVGKERLQQSGDFYIVNLLDVPEKVHDRLFNLEQEVKEHRMPTVSTNQISDCRQDCRVSASELISRQTSNKRRHYPGRSRLKIR